MIPRERVLAALEHREGDRIPWGEHFIDYNVYEDILGRPTLVHSKFRETQAYWDGRRDDIVADYIRDGGDLIRALDMDIYTVGMMAPKGYAPKPLKRIDHETFEDEGGNLHRISATTHDLRPWKIKPNTAYQPPTLEGLQQQIDQFDPNAIGDPADSCWDWVRAAVAEMKPTHYIVLLCGDLEWPTFGANEEEGWMNLILQPEICRKICQLRQLHLTREVKLFAMLGVDGIMPCGDLGSSTSLMASPQIYRDMVLPVHQAHVAAAHAAGLHVLKHCCGHVWPIIDDLADTYDAYEGIQASAGMDIAALKQRVGDRLCLWGGIWHEHIIAGGIDDIRADAAHAFANAAPGGGFIMGSTHSIAVGAKAANVLEMKRLVNDWGRYPLGHLPL
ncbi:MAG: uroporphyrinogen decarboxylase family protein [Planctomycetaceae bacterium]|nr:hypothetical protein [Planctomycetaceae bacterium]